MYESSFVSALNTSAEGSTHIVIDRKVFLACLSGMAGLLYLHLRDHPLLILLNPFLVAGRKVKIFTILLEVL